MKMAGDIIANKFNQLVQTKWDTHSGISTFTRAERAIWLLVTVRCEIDMEGFTSVFDQALSRSEVVETIDYLRELDLPEIAELFEQAVFLLDTNNFYSPDGTPITGSWDLPSQPHDELKAIGRKMIDRDRLWNIDVQLANMLDANEIARFSTPE